jgi:hypothetical protein
MKTPTTPRVRAGLFLDESAEQVLRRDVERFQESEQGGEPGFADSAFDPADLHGGEAGRVREVFLRPAALKAGCADVCSELLDG